MAETKAQKARDPIKTKAVKTPGTADKAGGIQGCRKNQTQVEFNLRHSLIGDQSFNAMESGDNPGILRFLGDVHDGEKLVADRMNGDPFHLTGKFILVFRLAVP